MADARNMMNEMQLVVFDLASEHYGVDISDVREIMRMQSVTRVPGAMAYVEGVINLRGKVLPVLDLRKRLGMKVAEQTDESRIVVIDIADGEVGVIVDAVTEVLRIPSSSIEPPSAMITQGTADYLRGIAKLPNRLIILLDVNKLLSNMADSEAIARVLADAAAEADEEKEEVAPKNGNQAKKKVEVVSKKNNNKEYAVSH
jgi:purine-binding chemotaxis protein CheW